MACLPRSTVLPIHPACSISSPSVRRDYDLREVTVSYATASLGTAHVDLGGKIDGNGIVSYRFNGVFGEGDAWVDDSHAKRVLGALAIDVRPLQDTVIETNYSYYHLIDTGYPGWFTYSEKINLPPAPDPHRRGLWTELRGRRPVDAHGQHAFEARFQFRLAFGGGRSQSRRVARHHHAGQQSDQQQRQLHLIARQRLRAALHHHERCGVSGRQLHDRRQSRTI